MTRPGAWAMASALAFAFAAGCGSSGPEPLGPSRGCRPGEPLAALRAEERSIDVDGVSRTYVLDVPAGASDEARPVVLAFHGFGAQGRRLRRWSMLGRMGHRRGAIVVFPDGADGVTLRGQTGRGWNTDSGSPDVAFVRAILDALEGEFCVDRDRVWATGMSNGAAFVSRLGCDLADRLAGIAPVAGATVIEGCAPARPLAVQIVHGRGDRIVPVETARAARDWWVTHAGCSEGRDEEHCRYWDACPRGRVGYCEAGQGHTWPRPASRRIMAFFGIELRRRSAGPSDDVEPPATDVTVTTAPLPPDVAE